MVVFDDLVIPVQIGGTAILGIRNEVEGSVEATIYVYNLYPL